MKMGNDHELTNRSIKELFIDRDDYKFYLMKSELLGVFANWVVQQSPYDTPDINNALKGYNKFLEIKFDTKDKVIAFTYSELNEYISEDVFENIPEIEILNHSKLDAGEGFIASSSRYHTTRADYNFIDLSALARNIFYDICRSHLTQPL